MLYFCLNLQFMILAGVEARCEAGIKLSKFCLEHKGGALGPREGGRSSPNAAHPCRSQHHLRPRRQ